MLEAICVRVNKSDIPHSHEKLTPTNSEPKRDPATVFKRFATNFDTANPMNDTAPSQGACEDCNEEKAETKR